jgi:hypothetical protein
MRRRRAIHEISIDELVNNITRAIPSKLSRSRRVRSRGREPMGSFNPLIIGELFWELSSPWEKLAHEHIDRVAETCETFTEIFLAERCLKDVRPRLQALKITDTLKTRRAGALSELQKLIEDKQEFPLIYGNQYSDSVQESRQTRLSQRFSVSVSTATTHEHLRGCNSTHTSAVVDMDTAVQHFGSSADRDAEKNSCEDILDALLAMYKVSSCRQRETSH